MIQFRINAGTLRKLAWQPDSQGLWTIELDGHSYQASHWTPAGKHTGTSYLGRARGPVPVFASHLFAVADDDRIEVRDSTGEELYTVHLAANTTISALGLNAEATWLASVRPWQDYELRSSIHIHELHTPGAVPHSIFQGTGRVIDVAFNANSHFLMATSDIGLTLWDLLKKETGWVQRVLGLRSAVWAPDSMSLYLRKEKRIECRTAWDGRVRWEQALAQRHNDLALSPDGAMLAAIDGDRVRLLASVDGREKAAFHWDIGPLTSIAFAPDGLTIAAGSASQIVLWDLE